MKWIYRVIVGPSPTTKVVLREFQDAVKQDIAASRKLAQCVKDRRCRQIPVAVERRRQRGG